MKIRNIVAISCVVIIILICALGLNLTSKSKIRNNEICHTVLNREIVKVYSEKMPMHLKKNIEKYNTLTTEMKLLATNVVLTSIYGDINGAEYMELTEDEQMMIDMLSDCLLYENFEQHIIRETPFSYKIFNNEEEYIDIFEKINKHTDIEYFNEKKEDYYSIIEDIIENTSDYDDNIYKYIDKRMIIPGELIKRYGVKIQGYMYEYNYLTADIFKRACDVSSEYIEELPGKKNLDKLEQCIKDVAVAILYEESSNIIYNSSLASYFSLEKAGSGGAWPRFLADEVENADRYYQLVKLLYNNIE